jgi:ubiquinone/menaquinone biosynthesis C-methylase UbiE
VQPAGDARNLYWFRDNVLDYVFSSHLLEDFEDIETVLREWLRVLKVGGHLILFCPDEKIFRGQGFGYNPHHKHQDFSIEFVEKILFAIGNIEIIHKCPLVDGYSWEIVASKMR